jgi:hypothetical protein
VRRAFPQIDLERTQLAGRDDWEWPLSTAPGPLGGMWVSRQDVVGGSARQAAGVRHGHGCRCWVYRDADRQGRRVGGAEDEVVHCAVVLDEMAGGSAASHHDRSGGGLQPGCSPRWDHLAPSDDLPVRRCPGASPWRAGAVLVDAPIFVALEVLQDGEATRAGDSAGAVLLRQALVAPPMTIEQVGGDCGPAWTIGNPASTQRTRRRHLAGGVGGCGLARVVVRRSGCARSSHR